MTSGKNLSVASDQLCRLVRRGKTGCARVSWSNIGARKADQRRRAYVVAKSLLKSRGN